MPTLTPPFIEPATEVENQYRWYFGADSIGDNYSKNVRPSRMYPARVGQRARADGCLVDEVNCGVAGDTSGPSGGHPGLTSAARLAQMVQYGAPDVWFIEIGINDPAAGFSQATTQANITTVINYLKTAQTNAGKPIQGAVIGAHFVDFGNTYAAGTDKDTLSVDYTAWVGVRAAQLAAATAGGSGVVFVDSHALYKALIPGAYALGSHSWMFADGDIHLNELGQDLLSGFVYAAVPTAWKDAAKAMPS